MAHRIVRDGARRLDEWMHRPQLKPGKQVPTRHGASGSRSSPPTSRVSPPAPSMLQSSCALSASTCRRRPIARCSRSSPRCDRAGWLPRTTEGQPWRSNRNATISTAPTTLALRICASVGGPAVPARSRRDSRKAARLRRSSQAGRGIARSRPPSFPGTCGRAHRGRAHRFQ